jgi:hypothetical protein
LIDNAPPPPFVWLSQDEYDGGGDVERDEFDADAGDWDCSKVDVGFIWSIFTFSQRRLHSLRYFSKIEDSIGS